MDGAGLGPVEIRVPPDPSLSRVLRLAASGLASLAGFSVDEIEDVKIAVSELLIALIEHGNGKPIDVTIQVDAASMRLEGRTVVEEFDLQHPDLVLCRTVLAEVCSDHVIDFVDQQVRISGTLRHLPTD
jgi:hypothetical protein